MNITIVPGLSGKAVKGFSSRSGGPGHSNYEYGCLWFDAGFGGDPARRHVPFSGNLDPIVMGEFVKADFDTVDLWHGKAQFVAIVNAVGTKTYRQEEASDPPVIGPPAGDPNPPYGNGLVHSASDPIVIPQVSIQSELSSLRKKYRKYFSNNPNVPILLPINYKNTPKREAEFAFCEATLGKIFTFDLVIHDGPGGDGFYGAAFNLR